MIHDRLSRRELIALASASALSTAAGLPNIAVRAAPPPTIRVGEIEITVLSDGNLSFPVTFLARNAEPAEIEAVLKAAGVPSERVEPPCNVTLVRTAKDLILIDAGAGPNFSPTAGRLLDNLDAAGLRREAVTRIVYTHAHPDHLWGTLDDFDESPNFPNAAYVIAAEEWNFWTAEDAARRMPPERMNFAPGARRNLMRIKDKIRTVKPGEEIAPGLRAVDTAGHTAGHISIEISSGREQLIVLGDALTHIVVSFAHPEWKPASDHHDPDKAVATRKRLLDRLAADKTPVVGFHLPFPGLGRVERKGMAYAFAAGA
jgi:glyoxylase-like metal-dependent hydrolase (beta-lactamase superfamily II)